MKLLKTEQALANYKVVFCKTLSGSISIYLITNDKIMLYINKLIVIIGIIGECKTVGYIKVGDALIYNNCILTGYKIS